MAKSKVSSDREKWNKVFNAMVRMLRMQQTQLESLAKDRKLLEDRIKLQYNRWVSDVNLFQDQIIQMKNEFTVQEMHHMVEVAKADLLMGLKQRQAFVYKHKFENADSELADFRDWFDYLSQKCSGQKDIKMAKSNGLEEWRQNLENEIRRLQCENEKLTLDKESEISALLSEKKFIWNQYDRMEKDLNKQLKQKQDEIECTNDKIHTLVAGMEELQSSNVEKDQMLLTLKNDFAKLKSDSVKKDEEISRLSKGLQASRKPRDVTLVAGMEELQSSNAEKDQMLLTLKKDVAKLKSDCVKKDEEISRLSKGIEASRKSRDDNVTPVLRQCTAESSGTFQSKSRRTKTVGRVTTIKKELDSSHHNEKKGCRSSKRKDVGISSSAEAWTVVA